MDIKQRDVSVFPEDGMAAMYKEIKQLGFQNFCVSLAEVSKRKFPFNESSEAQKGLTKYSILPKCKQ